VSGCRVVGLLLAAGSGTRLGGQAKAFLEVGGEPLFLLSLRSMVRSGAIDGVVVMIPEGFAQTVRRWEQPLADSLQLFLVKAGGDTRQESVLMGIDALPGDTEVVVCHDAARPFATPDLFRRVVAAVGRADGVVPVIASPDTVKRVDDGRVLGSIARETVRLAQTPQGFSTPALRRAHQKARERGLEGTDDATLLEAAGFTVMTVEGEPDNFKVTTDADLTRAKALVESRAAARSERPQ
jgi:2-C-methyl-D-erythritol 4-phosphate cytidylyltransferase